jgi:uncharacterized GH25 family protein
MFDSNTQRVSNTRMFAIVAGMAIAVMTTVPLRVTAAVQAARDQKATVDIMLTSKPSPPKTGENTFEVMVKDAAGKPITDAEVTAMFVMAATKTMPEMKNNVTLKHTKEGSYTGSGQVAMAGNWDVTVTVKRAGKELGSKKFPITAK